MQRYEVVAGSAQHLTRLRPRPAKDLGGGLDSGRDVAIRWVEQCPTDDEATHRRFPQGPAPGRKVRGEVVARHTTEDPAGC